jgi:hypothetical protein
MLLIALACGKRSSERYQEDFEDGNLGQTQSIRRAIGTAAMIEIIGRPNEPAQFLTTSNIAWVRNLSEINSDPWRGSNISWIRLKFVAAVRGKSNLLNRLRRNSLTESVHVVGCADSHLSRSELRVQ